MTSHASNCEIADGEHDQKWDQVGEQSRTSTWIEDRFFGLVHGAYLLQNGNSGHTPYFRYETTQYVITNSQTVQNTCPNALGSVRLFISSLLTSTAPWWYIICVAPVRLWQATFGADQSHTCDCDAIFHHNFRPTVSPMRLTVSLVRLCFDFMKSLVGSEASPARSFLSSVMRYSVASLSFLENVLFSEIATNPASTNSFSARAPV